MIRMVVSSFYNTLIDSEEAISTKTMLEIDRIRQSKVLFSINTNKNYNEVLDYNKDFPFIDYIISLNGNYIYDVNKNKCIYKNKLTTSIINKINKIFKDYEIIYYTNNNSYTKLVDEDIYKIDIKMKNKSDLNKLSDLNIKTSIFNNYIEITKDDNFNGLEKLSNKLKIELNDILVICCNDSDISLINNIKNNYIVKNSKLKKNKYTKVTDSNDKNGVEKVLKEV